MNFLLCHGWGFDASFWKNLAPHLAPHTFYTVDLGYFGNPNPFPTSGTWIGVGHSLGLIKLLQTPLSFSAIIGLNSFLNFLGPPLIHERRKKELQTMIQRFEKDPLNTIASFYKRCGVLDAPNGTINKSLLLNDLKSLFFDYSNLLTSVPCLSLASKNDLIVPQECRLGKGQLVFDDTGHRLGLYHSQAVKTKMFENLVHS